ncbi:MAG: hypothetical protein HKP55_11110 [Gammaproteobacteria bacterium]|nr:hypothetical protein [Gammaproteobacteria bacterium]
MNNPQDDKIAELYQKIPKARPSEILDARIRQEARRQPRQGRSLTPYRWFSVAALIVLSVGVVLRIIDEVPVEQSLQENLELMEMDAAPVIKEESKAVMRADGVTVQAEKMKKAAQPAAPLARMKVQQVPAPVESSTVASKPEFTGTSQAEYDMESLSDTLARKEAQFLPENYCGMEQLRGVTDKQLLQEVLDQLLSEKQLQQAECLKKLMNRGLSE